MKKKIALMVSAAMLLPIIPSAYAADADMEKILTEVKERIGNTDEYDQFRSDSYENNGHTIYQFSWSKEDGSESFDISCNDEGIITNYNTYDGAVSHSDTKHIPDVTAQQAEQTARDFINKVNPEISSQLTLEVNEASALDGSYTIAVKRSLDGISVYNDDGYIRLNNDNTAVEYFNLNYQYVSPVADKSGFISEDEAKAAFKEKIGMELVYRSYTENDGNTKYFPVYVVKDHDKYIDALTGEAREMELYARYGLDQTSGGGASKNEAAMDAGLSEAEIAELEKISGLISKDDAEKLARENQYLGIGNSIKLNSISLSRSYRDKDSYMYSLSFRNDDSSDSFNVVLDAADGSVISFNRYNNGEDKENDDAKAKEFIEALSGERLKNYVYNEETNTYERYENGVRVEDDSAWADVYDGVLYGFGINYSKNAQFPSVDGVMSADEAADKMFGMVLYNINYVSELENKTGCLYIPDDNPSVDPFTGEKLDYKGEPMQDIEMAYTDIDGHYAQEIIERLAVYGIGFEGGEFKPDEKITHKDYSDFLEKAFGRVYIDARNDSAENNEEDNSPVTRAQAAVMMIDALGVGEYAAYDIYKQPFADVSENTGYIAILAAMGVVQGDENGNFNPDNDITRAEAAIMVYNYLNR